MKEKLFLTFPLLLVTVLLISCSTLYFETLPPPSQRTTISSLSQIPYHEAWFGIVFNGEKVGFSRISITPIPGSEEFTITSESHISIRFLGLNWQVHMKSEDVVKNDLTLKSFQYSQKVNNRYLEAKGRVENNNLTLSVKSQETMSESKIPIREKIFPASAINLYPVIYGLNVGMHHEFLVFEPMTAHIYKVKQKVVSYEKSPRLGVPPAFRVETEMEGFSVKTWINASGETEMEMGFSGILISYRENEEEAKRYLVESSLAKKDLAYDFSLVKTNRPIKCPRNAKSITVMVIGLPAEIKLPSGGIQKVKADTENGKTVHIIRVDTKAIHYEESITEHMHQLYLSPSPQIESHHPTVIKISQEIVKDTRDEMDKVKILTQWVAREISKELADSFSALEVLNTKKGECQAHTMLYTALARAAKIPTRLVGGLVYLEEHGFLYHSWAESFVNRWIPVDPTFGQVPVDATHIKIVDGPDWSSFLSLSKVVGRISIKVIDYTCDEDNLDR
ncbi:MAG: transglutaminase-like domain-containing protein [Syntrophales bacterium]|nr:transglutaminase-like domain-containing protein [Syntrophales bacterium]